MGESFSLRQVLKRHFPTFPVILKFLLFALLLLVLAVLVGSVVYNIFGSSRLRDARQKAAEAMVPLTLEAYEAKRGAIENAENAAAYYQAAFWLVRANEREDTYDLFAQDHPDITPLDALQGDHVAALRALLEDKRDVLDTLHKAAALPECRFPLDAFYYDMNLSGFQPPLPHLSRARQCARLLSLGIRLAAEEGRGADGISLARDGVALSRSLEKEPFLISALVGMACASISLSNDLSRLLARTDIPNEELAALQADLEDYARNYTVRPALEGDLVQVCGIHNCLLEGKTTIRRIIRTLESTGEPVSLRERIADVVPVWLIAGYLKSDQAVTINYFVENVKAVDSPSRKVSPAALDRLLVELATGPYPVSATFAPSISRALVQSDAHRARLSAAAVALAALRFKNDTGDWPESLENLVPSYISKIPADPFTGRQLVYRFVENGIVVYSAGENGRDDGGKPRLVRPAGGDKGGSYDDYAGLRIWRAESEPGYP